MGEIVQSSRLRGVRHSALRMLARSPGTGGLRISRRFMGASVLRQRRQPQTGSEPIAQPMTFAINTHDAWGVARVGEFQSLQEARLAFAALCEDPWYRSDGTVRGVELVQTGAAAGAQRLAWFAFA